MAVTVSSPIKMSTLQLKGDINWALNDYAEEPSQIGTKQGTSSDFSRGLKIGLKMRLIAVWEKKGGRNAVRGRGERGWNYRVQRARIAYTNDISMNYFIQHFLYVQVCMESTCLVPICCLLQELHACHLRTAHV